MVPDPGHENNAARANTAAVITRDELKNIRAQIGKGAQKSSQVAVIQKSDLDRIRKEVLLKEKAQLD